MSSGNEGCKCIDQSSVLASLADLNCTTTSGVPGVRVKSGGFCVGFEYGSSTCLRHDRIHDPNCKGFAEEVPTWCFQSWCYVDANSCTTNSEEDIYKSNYFPVDIFYSYATCNETDSFWLDYVESSLTSASVAGGVNISAIVPFLEYPLMNKRLSDGTLVWNQTEDITYYFDNNIPFGGIYIDYINSIVQISNGDIQNVTFSHTSRASLKRYPADAGTAAVRDVANGLVDMAVGPFWITKARLKMTSFTVPLTYDRAVLVIPRPGTKNNLAFQTQKVFEPFTNGLWLVLLALILVASLLSVWFSDREMAAKKRYGLRLRQSRMPKKKRKTAYFRLMLDAFLEKGMFFFSAGIEQDMGASLPHKVLMFGFGFFILIAVSAYVANLAAFLTQSGLEKSVGSMQLVVDRNIPICGHQALKEEFQLDYPKANWLFPSEFSSGGGYMSMLEAYARGDCKVLTFGREETGMNVNVLKRMCELDLVYTDILVHENPIAFPIKKELASAFSYWMYAAETLHDMDFKSKKQEFVDKNDINPQCEVELSQLNNGEADDFARVSPGNMFFPIMLFVTCALIAAALQLYHDSMTKKGRTIDLGRKSTLDIYLESVVRRLSATIHANADEGGEEGSRRPFSNGVRFSKSVARRLSDAGGEVGPTRPYSNGVRFTGDFPEDNIFDDEFNENGAPQAQSSPGSGPTFRGSSKEDTDKINDGGDAAAAVNVEDDDIDQRLEELVESGMIDEVLDCFDFLQEMKLKKDR